MSYHHQRDQAYYDAFSRLLAELYDVIDDRSLDEAVDSTNSDYIIRVIREEYITGTSCTVLLVGADTHRRKFVDWELIATLNKHHGLIGVALPSALRTPEKHVIVPQRFLDNYTSGYALWTHWNNVINAPRDFPHVVALAKSKLALLINNSAPKLLRND